MKKYTFLKLYAIIISVLCLLILSAFLFLFHRAGYDQKILVRLGLAKPTAEANWAVGGWNNTLMKLDYDADVVFLGDSITSDSDFQAFFPNCRIVNLGYYGDTLAGMIQRVPGAAALSPETVFIMGGINGLTDQNVDVSIQVYRELLDELESALPEAKIIIQSVLPIAAARQQFGIHNATIQEFNRQLSAIAEERNMKFVDLYSLYEKNGEIDPALSRDGLHLRPEAYSVWAEAIAEFIN